MTYKFQAMSDAADLSRFKWHVEPGCKGQSLTAQLASYLLLSEEEASDLIDFGSARINGRLQRNPETKLQGNEEIEVYWPLHGVNRSYEVNAERIIFRDRFLLAYDKEPGIPSQQTPADAYNNLFAALQRFLQKEAREAYISLHHRLDRDTSGVMLFVLDRSVNRSLGELFHHHRVIKDYLAWIEGNPERDDWVCSDEIGRRNGRYQTSPRGRGKTAQTRFQVLFREQDRTLIRARPQTGRTHQIRLHLAASGHPILGDRLYGNISAERLYLHAFRLILHHPRTHSRLVLTAPISSQWPAYETVESVLREHPH
jgi:23S rRNA pseudouridine1911/1915/1917 synthase